MLPMRVVSGSVSRLELFPVDLAKSSMSSHESFRMNCTPFTGLVSGSAAEVDEDDDAPDASCCPMLSSSSSQVSIAAGPVS